MSFPLVTEVTFEMVVDGQRRVMTFIRSAKIDDLMNDDDTTLGGWLRALRDLPPPTD